MRTTDLERIVGKISYESANPKDLLQLKKSLSVIPEIKKIICKIKVDDYFDLYVYVVDSNGNVIGSDDDSGKNGAFKLPFVAYEGETYNIYVGTYSEQDSFLISLSSFNHSYCFDNDYDGYCDGCWDLICGCNCHKGGISGFFWSISNFFNKLFRINRMCDCGVKHW